MRPVNGFFLFDLGQVWQLTWLAPGMDIQPHLPLLGRAHFMLELFVNHTDNQNDLPSSVYEASELMKTLKAIIQRPTEKITFEDQNIIQHILLRFRAILNSELGKTFTFVVEEKRGFNSATLWRNPLKLFSGEIAPLLSDFVTTNFDEAAKCLLLDRHTAVGFHVMRAVECVARRYYELVTNNLPPYKNKYGDEYFKQLGNILQELRDKHDLLQKTSQSVGSLGLSVGNLEPLRKLYRNPLSHPEIETLDQDQAIDALFQATNVISLMILDVKKGGAHFAGTWTVGSKF